MKATPGSKTIKDLLELKKFNMLYANAEYQRGAVWTKPQKKRLVDSVFRGYPIPLIYLHHISKEVAGAKRDDFEVIDGQQRINALHEYKEGSFKLFDPSCRRGRSAVSEQAFRSSRYQSTLSSLPSVTGIGRAALRVRTGDPCLRTGRGTINTQIR
jgi:hypothetical protein